MSDKFEGKARQMGGRVQEAVGETIGDSKTQAEGLYNQAAGRVQQAVGQAHDAADQFTGMVRAQPLVAAAVALGVGYLVGRLRS
ncbi:MAG TPA: CsbD family protein [Acetobacteraceae bacterium]|jgi:uncharacterized protein YjbJ (UPF0337 family)